MGKCSQSCAVDSRDRAHHRVLRLGVLRTTSDGSKSVVQQSEENYDRHFTHHFPQWRQLFRHASILADSGLQRLW
jgi:hypothetical protein